MIKFVIIFLIILFSSPPVLAQSNSFVSIVNPVRGEDFWDLKDQRLDTSVKGEADILRSENLIATWLIRFDALDNKEIIDLINSLSLHEKGLFLEVTPIWTKAAGVEYHNSENWHDAGSAFLTGYKREEREKLIDAAFTEFKKIFGQYPESVGAWWIDSYSLDYMQKKYGIIAGLIVSDQYTTDNYQIWGQYFSTPYYPDKKNALHPAQSVQNKIPVVLSQWAPRDPVNGYGNGVFESTFSVQANDYKDFHKLNSDYFSKLLDVYTKGEFNRFGSAVVGLENTYLWDKYKEEYKRQIEVLSKKQRSSQFKIVTLKDFALWYQKTFPDISPEHLIYADDPLGSFKKAVWFMNPYFRAGLFVNQDGIVFRDIRQYIEGEEEICFQERCSEVNFATFATRVLDEVTYGHKWVIDEGKISNFKVSKTGEKFIINYLNEAGKAKVIEFLPRDIAIDGKISSIDGAILDAIKQENEDQKKQSEFKSGSFNWSFFSVLVKMGKFALFLVIAFLIPGLVLTNKLFDKDTPYLKRIFLAIVGGFVFLTIIFYILSLLNLRLMIFAYFLISFLIALKLDLLIFLKPKSFRIKKLGLISALVIIAGTVFQNIPTFKNGLVFPFGMGFWGPNTHDGIWHVSLINQLIRSMPVENPIFSGTILKNYHYLYDLLVAATAFFTNISVLDLVFRFYPIIFSILLGIGTYYLALNLFKNRIGVIFSLYFVYFSGSFGWIVEYIKGRNLGGESAFWANQSISFNLNPPFAVSLLIIIAFLHILQSKKINSPSGILIASTLLGSIIGFKAYAGVLSIVSLILIVIINIFKKDFSYLYIFVLSSIFALLIFLSNFQSSQQLIIFSPFWLIHSMIDSPDRVGWARLSLARIAGLETKNWFKFISAEIISFILFIAGNLGIRILSLFSLLKFKDIVWDNTYLFLLIFSLLSFLIPVLFIQSGNPWNTIQFSYYGLYITAVVSGAVLSSLIFKLPKFLSLIFALLILAVAPVNSITTASYYTPFLPHGRIDQKELEALEFLSRQAEGTVLTFPYEKKLKNKVTEPWPLYVYDSTAYVSALSGKAVYLEDEGQNQILLTDYKKRMVLSKDFFAAQSERENEFLKKNNIKYIYIAKIYERRLDEQTLNIKNIFENDMAIIYQVK